MMDCGGAKLAVASGIATALLAVALGCAGPPAAGPGRPLEAEFGSDGSLSASTRYEKARADMEQRDYYEAEALLVAVLHERPEDLPALCDLAKLHLREGRYEEAMAALEKALATSARNPVLLNNLGVCYLCQGSIQEAVAVFSEATALEPSNPRYCLNLALALGMRGDIDRARRLYRIFLSSEETEHNLRVIREMRDRLGESATNPGNPESPGAADPGREAHLAPGWLSIEPDPDVRGQE